MPEHWKDISGFEGFYEVSSLGRIRSRSRYYYLGKGYHVKRFHLGVLLTQHKGPEGENRVRFYCRSQSYIRDVYEIYVEAFCKIDFGEDPQEEVTVFELDRIHESNTNL